MRCGAACLMDLAETRMDIGMHSLLRVYITCRGEGWGRPHAEAMSMQLPGKRTRQSHLCPAVQLPSIAADNGTVW